MPRGSQRVLGEIERKAIGVVERERGLTLEPIALPEAATLLVEDGEPALQRLAKASFLELERLCDQRLGAVQLGIGLAHLAGERGHEPPHQRVDRTEQLGVPHGAPHDAAEHIAAAFVRRQHAIGDQERRRTQVIGDDTVRHAARPIGLDAGEIGDVGDDGAEEVDLVVVVGPLQHRGDALEPHAGVDRGSRQRDALAAGELLVLHEDQIPNLDEAIAVGVGRAGRSAGNMRPVVVENLRAGAAGAEVTHLPEIVGAGDARDLALGQARDLLP